MFGHSVPSEMPDQAVTAGPNALVLVQNLGQINVYSLGNCVDPHPTPPPPSRYSRCGWLASKSETDGALHRRDKAKLSKRSICGVGWGPSALHTHSGDGRP